MRVVIWSTMREFDPEIGYRVLVRCVCGVAGTACLIVLAFHWFRMAIVNAYDNATFDAQEFRSIAPSLGALFWIALSLVTGRFVWFVPSRRFITDLRIFVVLLGIAIASYFYWASLLHKP